MAERLYAEYFSFLLDNTSTCYICVHLHLSSLSLYLLITTMIVINYGLECVTNSVLAYIHLSAHILFVYKLVLVILILRV